METTELLALAVERVTTNVNLIDDEQWDLPTPAGKWTVRDVLNHLVYELSWIPDLMSGKTIIEVGDKYEGDLLGSDPKTAWKRLSGQALEAVKQPGAMEQTVHLSNGDFTGEHYAFEAMCDVVIHGWDIARGAHLDAAIDPTLAEAIYAHVLPLEDEMKASGLFGDKIQSPDDADLQTKLLAIFGRTA